MEELRSWRFLLKNECCGFGIPSFWRILQVLLLVLLLLDLEQRRLSVLLFWEARGVGGGEIGSEHEEDVYEICGQVKETRNPKKEVPFYL